MDGRCRIHSATIQGVTAVPVLVEAFVTTGLPGFVIVGMPDKAIQEARERIRSAIKACGFSMPTGKIIVNLAPGSLKKTGTGFDLPIAIALLAATNQIPDAPFSDYLVVGELSLNGEVRRVPGLLAFALCAQREGLSLLSFPLTEDAIPIDGLIKRSISALSRLKSMEFENPGTRQGIAVAKGVDFKDVSGQEFAKRALLVAAAGNHGVLMSGPPGSGKTMLASRLPTILPSLNQEEMMETAVIHSVAGLDTTGILAGIRPFRSPHHSTTLPGLVGGGTPVRPGEISLAHNGVLFLDELAEFKVSVLQSIRQPLESGNITVTRADGTLVFPARFVLVAATNPCPCGYYGDPSERCTCTMGQIQTYQNRIGGPLMDRFDIHIDVARINAREVVEYAQGEDSASMREHVEQARAFAEECTRAMRGGSNEQQIIDDCRLSDKDRNEFARYAESLKMSGRSIIKSLSLARTIANLDFSETVQMPHLLEALDYRKRKLGGDHGFA